MDVLCRFGDVLGHSGVMGVTGLTERDETNGEETEEEGGGEQRQIPAGEQEPVSRGNSCGPKTSIHFQ